MLIRLNIEMSMAELLGKVVKNATQHRTTLATTSDFSQPEAGIDLDDHQWLGSAKSIPMPKAPFSCHLSGDDDKRGQTRGLGGRTAAGMGTTAPAVRRRSGQTPQGGEGEGEGMRGRDSERGRGYEGDWAIRDVYGNRV